MDQISSERLVLTMFRKLTVRAHIPGQAASQSSEETIELGILCADGKWRSIEMSAQEFFDLIYKEIFPRLSKRVAKARKS